MCDKCGVIFSEAAEGWGVGTISTMVKNERTRRPEQVMQSIDLCPVDNAGPTDHLMPQTMSRFQVAGVAEANRLADIQPQEPDGE
jgi:hypothetical protein